MAVKYEIFTVEADADTKSAQIDTDFGYPDVPTKTDRYRDLIKHKTDDKWAAIFDDQLVTACASMSVADRKLRYDDTVADNVKTYQQLVDEGWLPDYE